MSSRVAYARNCCQQDGYTVPTSFVLHAAIGAAQWLGRPESPLLRTLAPHGYLHAMMCMGLVMTIYASGLFTGSRLMARREGYSAQLHVTFTMLVMGFGLQGTLFFGAMFLCLEVYAHESQITSEMSVPSQPQAAGQRPIKPGAKSIKDIVEGRLGNVPQGILFCLEHVIAPSHGTCVSYSCPCCRQGKDSSPGFRHISFIEYTHVRIHMKPVLLRLSAV